MLYAKIHNGNVEKYPYSVGLLRKENPMTVFPKRPSDELLADFGVYPVKEANVQAGEGQKVEKSWTPEKVGDEWVLAHKVVDKTAEELTADSDRLSAEARATRDDLLTKTDYFALTDVTMDDDMSEYRQALRDITTHANFPNLADEDWPVAP
jgi:hypothetical protein